MLGAFIPKVKKRAIIVQLTNPAVIPNFSSDYQEGAHQKVLDALVDTNMEQSSGYGTDEHCEHARDLIRAACNAPNADVHFLVGGTQTNATIIDAILLPWQGVIAPHTGHINMHEAGIVERGGHKILDIPAKEGKITAANVIRVCDAWEGDGARDHMIAPALVYIFPAHRVRDPVLASRARGHFSCLPRARLEAFRRWRPFGVFPGLSGK